jgi:hypothetical protein
LIILIILGEECLFSIYWRKIIIANSLTEVVIYWLRIFPQASYLEDQ